MVRNMDVSRVADWLRQRQSRWLIALGVTLTVVALMLLGQALASLLAVIVGVLLLELEQRNERTRLLARQLIARQTLEKQEVPQGSWGELCRAINALVQEQRMQDRLRTALPGSLPANGVRAMIKGELCGDTQRTVAVLLIGGAGAGQAQAGRECRPSLAAWQTLANASQLIAQQHGALLQPCGDAIMLVFGAFSEHPVAHSLLAAVAAAEGLRTAWQGHIVHPLAFGITSGTVTVTTLPGLGCCVLGSPVEQALHIERLAIASPFYRMLCDETAYYALRRYAHQTWRPTEFRIQSSEGRPQVVYGAYSE